MVEIGKRGNVSKDRREDLKKERSRNRENDGGEKRERGRGIG